MIAPGHVAPAQGRRRGGGEESEDSAMNPPVLRGALLVALLVLASASPVSAIDTDFLFSFGSSGAGNGQFNGPTQITIGPSGAVYVLDAGNQRMQKFDAEGNYLTQWVSARPFQGPMNTIAAVPDGRVYVQSTYWITAYDADGNYLQWWAMPVGSSSQSHYMNSDVQGMLYVTYAEGFFYNTVRIPGPNQVGPSFSSGSIAYSRVAVHGGGMFWFGSPITFNGPFVPTLYRRTPTGDAVSDAPTDAITDMTCDAAGNLYACERNNKRVRIYDAAGLELTSFGGPGSGPGQFSLPIDVAVAADGRIYVVDRDANRVQVFGNGATPALPATWGRIKADYR